MIGCEGNPLALHASMFMPSLIALASDEQKSKWLTRAINREIIGTYAQTEMGHGRFILHVFNFKKSILLNLRTIIFIDFPDVPIQKFTNDKDYKKTRSQLLILIKS